MNNKEILITGGTGSLARALLKILTTKYSSKGIRLFSRDELKQWEVRELYKNCNIPISYIIGDIRDLNSLKRAFKNVDIVIHTAAMKQIDTCENNPIEALNTNVNGAINVIEAAIFNNVGKVMNISTDKAVYPTNLYGSTKMSAEKLFENASIYTNGNGTIFASCRYGNVLGSRGSVIHAFKRQYDKYGRLFVTHPDMTRFFISLNNVAEFLIDRCIDMENGSIYVPSMKSLNINDLANIMYNDTYIDYIGIRKGEKLHECLINYEESVRTNLILSNKLDYYNIHLNNLSPNSSNFIVSSNSHNKFSKTEITKMIMEAV